MASPVCEGNPAGPKDIDGPLIYVGKEWCTDMVPSREGNWEARQDTLVLKLKVPQGPC